MGYGQSTSPFRFAIGDRVERLFGNRREVAVVTDRWVGGLSGLNWYLLDGGPQSGLSERDTEDCLAPTEDPVGVVWQQTTPRQFREFDRRRALDSDNKCPRPT